MSTVSKGSARYCSRFRRPRSSRAPVHSPRCFFASPPFPMHTEALTEEGRKLFPALVAFDSFYLAGGTALALQIGHRLSVDFDLFCNDLIDRTLLSKAKKVFAGFPVEPAIIGQCH